MYSVLYIGFGVYDKKLFMILLLSFAIWYFAWVLKKSKKLSLKMLKYFFNYQKGYQNEKKHSRMAKTRATFTFLAS